MLKQLEDEQYHFDISNECSCANYDPETDETTPLDYCEGDCWLETKDLFEDAIRPLWEASASCSYWRVDGLPLWNGSIDGEARVRNIEDLIRMMTVRGDWHLRGWLRDGYIEAFLSHHDRPMGGRLTCRPIDEESI